jgi:hypothetical protein
LRAAPSQISFFADLGDLLVSLRAAAIAVSASTSAGWRKVATTSPSSQEQFDSKKLSRRRFSARFLLREQPLGIPGEVEKRDALRERGI